MTYPWSDSTDTVQVVQALSNGLRSEVEIAKNSRLPIDRVRIALDSLVENDCVIAAPTSPDILFRLSDNGNDRLKAANAAARKVGI